MRTFYILCLFLIFMLASVSSAFAVESAVSRNPREQVTVDFLFEACSNVGDTAKGLIPFFDCESYVYGVLDTYLSIRQAIPSERRACFSDYLPPWKAIEAVRSLIKDDQWAHLGSKTAAPVIIELLAKKYPCNAVKPNANP